MTTQHSRRHLSSSGDTKELVRWIRSRSKLKRRGEAAWRREQLAVQGCVHRPREGRMLFPRPPHNSSCGLGHPCGRLQPRQLFLEPQDTRRQVQRTSNKAWVSSLERTSPAEWQTGPCVASEAQHAPQSQHSGTFGREQLNASKPVGRPRDGLPWGPGALLFPGKKITHTFS